MSDNRLLDRVADSDLTVCESESIDIDLSANDLIIVKDESDNKYVLKYTEYDQDEIQTARSIQSIATEKFNIAPTPRFTEYLDDGVIICDRYLDGYDHISPKETDSVDIELVCRQMGKTLGKLHNIDTKYYDKLNTVNEDYYSRKISYFWDRLDRTKVSISEESLQELKSLSDNYQSVSSLDRSVIHLTDFTTTNVLFNSSLSDCVIVDWEWVRKHSPILGLVGVLYRLFRLYFIELNQEQLWKSLVEGYSSTTKWDFEIPQFHSPIVKKWLVLSTLNEVSGFDGWCRWMSSSQIKSQSNHIENRIANMYDSL